MPVERRSDEACGYARDPRGRLNIAQDDGTRADGAAGADLYAGKNACADPEESAFTNRCGTGDDGTGRDVGAGADQAIVLDDRAGIDDGVRLDACEAVHHGARADKDARAQSGRARDHGVGGDDCRAGRTPSAIEFTDEACPKFRIANTNEVRAAGGRERGERTKMGQAEFGNGRCVLAIVQHAGDGETQSDRRVGDHQGVATGPDEHYLC